MTKIQLAVKAEAYAVVNLYISNPSERQDILQEIWIKLIEAYATYKENGHLLSWAHKIAKNTCVDFYRTKTRDQALLHEFYYYSKVVHSDGINQDVLKREILDHYTDLLQNGTSTDLESKILKYYFVKNPTITIVAKD